MTKFCWDGGYYQLTMYFSDKLVAYKGIQQLFLSTVFKDKYSEQTFRIKCSKLNDNNFYSLLKIGEHQLPCLISALAFDDNSGELTVALPVGSLNQFFDLEGYPFGERDTLDWQLPTNNALKEIALEIYNECKYRIAISGFETFEDAYDIDEIVNHVPEKRWDGFLIPINENVKWFPPTEYHPPLT